MQVHTWILQAVSSTLTNHLFYSPHHASVISMRHDPRVKQAIHKAFIHTAAFQIALRQPGSPRSLFQGLETPRAAVSLHWVPIRDSLQVRLSWKRRDEAGHGLKRSIEDLVRTAQVAARLSSTRRWDPVRGPVPDEIVQESVTQSSSLENLNRQLQYAMALKLSALVRC